MWYLGVCVQKHFFVFFQGTARLQFASGGQISQPGLAHMKLLAGQLQP